MTDAERIALVRATLESIGPLYETLLTWPNYLFPGPARYASKGECKTTVTSLGKIESALKDQRDALRKIPAAVAEAMPFTLERLIDEIDKVARLLREAKYEQKAIWGDGRGRGKNVRAYLIADEVARHFARSKLEKPTLGHDEDGHPTSDFTCAVDRIFGIVGFDADFRAPCREAASKITQEFIEDARRLNSYRAAYLAAVARRASGAASPEPTLLGGAGLMEFPSGA